MQVKFDNTRLRKRIREKNEPLKSLAAVVGVSPLELMAKLSNGDDFTLAEIHKMCDSLDILDGDVMEFFFKKN
jgi:DNA-binding Xre family transcriptional regulator